MKFLALIAILLLSNLTNAQTIEQGQLWGGLMTQYRVGKKLLVWNDAHFVPGGFFIIRTGYTQETKIGRFTGGLAHLWLPFENNGLKRNEWRPWAQWFLSKPLGENWQYQARIRYDARFRELIENKQLINNQYNFSNRYRFQFGLRYNILNINSDYKLFTMLGGELLINSGKNVYWLDQHRRNLTIGIAKKGLILQTGYMNRQNFANSGAKSAINHTWINWLILEF